MFDVCYVIMLVGKNRQQSKLSMINAMMNWHNHYLSNENSMSWLSNYHDTWNPRDTIMQFFFYAMCNENLSFLFCKNQTMIIT